MASVVSRAMFIGTSRDSMQEAQDGAARVATLPIVVPFGFHEASSGTSR